MVSNPEVNNRWISSVDKTFAFPWRSIFTLACCAIPHPLLKLFLGYTTGQAAIYQILGLVLALVAG
jgi:hypothetical protein